MRRDQDYFDDIAGVIRGKGKPSRPSTSGSSTTIIIEGDNHGTINIGPRTGDNLQEGNREESALSGAKHQMAEMLHELASLTTTLRELIAQLRRLAPSSALSQRFKELISSMSWRISNYLSPGPILASSICRTLFFTPSPQIPQPIDLTALPTNSPPYPLNPAYLNLTVAAQFNL